MNTVPLSKYCDLTGESPNAVKRRIERGIWVIGIQVIKIPNVRERWIDLDAVCEWARSA